MIKLHDLVARSSNLRFVKIEGIVLLNDKSYQLFRCIDQIIDLQQPSVWPDTWPCPYETSISFFHDQRYFVFQGSFEELCVLAKQIANEAFIKNTRMEFSKEKSLLCEEVRRLRFSRDMLRSETKRLHETNKALSQNTSQLEKVGRFFPQPELPRKRVTLKDSRFIPETSGCYFAWENGQVRYVGRAVNLRNRLKPGHHAIDEKWLLSWVEVSESDLYFAEAFYIGVLRPTKNIAKPAILRANA